MRRDKCLRYVIFWFGSGSPTLEYSSSSDRRIDETRQMSTLRYSLVGSGSGQTTLETAE